MLVRGRTLFRYSYRYYKVYLQKSMVIYERSCIARGRGGYPNNSEAMRRAVFRCTTMYISYCGIR